ncbi:hypothetical protein PSU4_07130 [Pseudonocardia sulfidoxydans NBRC 16205]|uniref:Transcriptional regulator LacI/GalR-like sensor domain-containing protein n=1 Tax=Pseudonocardia sulfidoxydans NBRC 16205 TaxID=1223511 RepID=A0A511DAC0_9PSEU|nr:LacI family DNA-binding transcriptional regulator [Pseudonocardia sulfidoxydans]GEL21759.1 hypothetical protein PSU4_07130 [Pseudonocardia sulfidoxydans NBRC 16205]
MQRFLAHRVDGLFYRQARPSKTLAWYERSNIPVIAVGFRDPECAQLPFVTVDGAPAFAAACRDLEAQGHRDFAEIVVDRADPLYALYPRMRGVRWHEIRIGHGEQDLRAAVEEHLTGSAAPTAVFAAPPTSTALLSIAGELGLTVPEDLSLVSYFDLEDASLFRTPLSAIRTDYDKLGHAVAAAMLDALSGRQVGDVVVPDSAHFVPRASTGPARGHRAG